MNDQLINLYAEVDALVYDTGCLGITLEILDEVIPSSYRDALLDQALEDVRDASNLLKHAAKMVESVKRTVAAHRERLGLHR